MGATGLGWKEAAIEVLKTTGPLHYTAIADQIIERKLRQDYGATPANSVSSAITASMNQDRENSPFVRLEPGRYGLRQKVIDQVASGGSGPQIEQTSETGLINAFGMYWNRDKVLWQSTPRILGQQQPGSKPVDFYDQVGVYLLHDARSVVYVGRATDQSIGKRLVQHTKDRLNGRWNRFSWFGVHRVGENGALQVLSAPNLTMESLVVTMEALLIEALEPPQNRKKGDEFRAIEYLQVEDPGISKARIVELINVLQAKMISDVEETQG
jgi:hypothetical protein